MLTAADVGMYVRTIAVLCVGDDIGHTMSVTTDTRVSDGMLDG